MSIQYFISLIIIIPPSFIFKKGKLHHKKTTIMYHKLQIIDCRLYRSSCAVYANRNISRIRVKIELFFNYGEVIKNEIINTIKKQRQKSKYYS